MAAYGATGATHAALHAWEDTAFREALEAIPEVTVLVPEEGEELPTDPITLTTTLIEANGAQWGTNAPPLTGNVIAGKLYRHTDDSLWWVIRSYNATAQVGFPDPTIIPALVRRARRPGVAAPWVQRGHVWIVSQGDGAGLNTWPPGQFGWTRRDGDPEPEPDEWPEWVQPTGAHDAYQIGEQVTFQGGRYVCVIDANVWSPAAFPQGWEPRS